MTNYNERLDEILEDLGDYHEHLYDNMWLAGNGEYTKEKAKQAITSLIKELVAEAKPTRSETQRGGVTVYGDLSERELNIIDQFEQNLLKALEEV